MKNLETFKSKFFAKELSREEIREIRGAFALEQQNDTGTRCNPTDNKKMDCGDDEGYD